MTELSQVDATLFAQDCPGLSMGTHLKIGGQKRVWRCAYNGEAYVIKAIMADARAQLRLEREIKIMRECDSPYLPKFGPLPVRQLTLDSGETILYFLEQYIDGLPLASVHTPMPTIQVCWLGHSVGEALRILELHGYVHRDVKPMNIIQKSSSTYVLIDAGLAIDFDGELSSIGAAPVGTAAYFSPEQIIYPSRELDGRSDLFSLGVTMYWCATGKHPFWNDEMPQASILQNIKELPFLDPRHFAPQLPTNLCEIISKLLQKDRNERFRNAEELLSALPTA